MHAWPASHIEHVQGPKHHALQVKCFELARLVLLAARWYCISQHGFYPKQVVRNSTNFRYSLIFVGGRGKTKIK